MITRAKVATATSLIISTLQLLSITAMQLQRIMDRGRLCAAISDKAPILRNVPRKRESARFSSDLSDTAHPVSLRQFLQGGLGDLTARLSFAEPLDNERKRIRRFGSDCVSFFLGWRTVPSLRFLNVIKFNEGKPFGRNSIKPSYVAGADKIVTAGSFGCGSPRFGKRLVSLWVGYFMNGNDNLSLRLGLCPRYLLLGRH